MNKLENTTSMTINETVKVYRPYELGQLIGQDNADNYYGLDWPRFETYMYNGAKFLVWTVGTGNKRMFNIPVYVKRMSMRAVMVGDVVKFDGNKFKSAYGKGELTGIVVKLERGSFLNRVTVYNALTRQLYGFEGTGYTVISQPDLTGRENNYNAAANHYKQELAKHPAWAERFNNNPDYRVF